MVLEYKVLFGSIAVLLAIGSYIPYVRDMFLGRTKPHAFSWFIWGTLTAIGFAAQVSEGAGAGAWVTGVSSLACYGIALFTFAKGDRSYSAFDWWSLVAAAVALILWVVMSEPLVALVLVILTDACGYLPTIRKAYARPHEETATTYAISSVKWVLAFPALAVVNLTTILYPLFLVVVNGGFALFLVIRRRQLSTAQKHSRPSRR